MESLALAEWLGDQGPFALAEWSHLHWLSGWDIQVRKHKLSPHGICLDEAFCVKTGTMSANTVHDKIFMQLLLKTSHLVRLGLCNRVASVGPLSMTHWYTGTQAELGHWAND